MLFYAIGASRDDLKASFTAKNSNRARPAGRRFFNFYRKSHDVKSSGRQLIKVGELFNLAVRNGAA